MYSENCTHGVDKGPGIVEAMTSETLADRNKSARRDVDYPNLELVIAYKGIVKYGKQPGMDDTTDHQIHEESIAFINGTSGQEAVLTLRMKNLKKGTYFVFYKPDFKPEHKVKRLNLVFYSEFREERTHEEKTLLKATHSAAQSQLQNLPSKISLMTPNDRALQRPVS